MANLPYPNPESAPANLGELLKQLHPRSAAIMLSHSPAIAQHFLGLARAQFTELALPARAREMIILIVASLSACEYEYEAHTSISEAAGVEPALREALWRRDFEAPVIGAADRLLVDFVSQTVNVGRVSSSTFAAMREAYTAREVVEIIELIGFYWMYGRLCTVLDIEVHKSAGQASIDAVVRDRGGHRV